MRLSTEGQAWLTETVRRIVARHHLPEPERAGVQYELMSHLHAAAERKAADGGRQEVGVGDLHAALLDMGGEQALAEAFVAPRSRPVPRAGVVKRTAAWLVDVVVIFFSWWILAGVLWLTVAIVLLPFGGGAGSPPDLFDAFDRGPPFWPFGAGMFGLGIVLTLAYFTYMEGSAGQTFGKKVFDLRVRRVDGAPAGYREAFVRSLAKCFIPILILDVVFMVLFFSREQQRVSDRIADTMVVEEVRA